MLPAPAGRLPFAAFERKRGHRKPDRVEIEIGGAVALTAMTAARVHWRVRMRRPLYVPGSMKSGSYCTLIAFRTSRSRSSFPTSDRSFVSSAIIESTR